MRARTRPRLLLRDCPEWVDVQGASDFLGLGRGTVHAMVMSGHLPSSKFGTRRLIRKADLVTFRGEQAAAPGTGARTR